MLDDLLGDNPQQAVCIVEEDHDFGAKVHV